MTTSPKQHHLGTRIVVVGATGSGKTTLACQLAQRLNLPHVELDALHWGPNWTMPPDEEFRQRVDEALSGPRWVTDGNYSKARRIIWQRADCLIWLDYSLPLIWGRLFRRAVRRIRQQEELWGSNRESWRGQFFSRDSLFLFAVTSRRKHHRTYPALLAQPEYAHLQVYHWRSPRETERWLQTLGEG
ncbi:MAG: adenylate kinase [Ardenticatenaceae bacterium]|nr:adenylate kinase [Ardenticatenaceae bacterium]